MILQAVWLWLKEFVAMLVLVVARGEQEYAA